MTCGIINQKAIKNKNIKHMKKNLEKLFNPVSVAVVGATEKDGKVGNVILKNLLELGFEGDVFPVNPKHKTILEKKAYASVSEIEDEVDLAIVAIPSKFVNKTILESSEKTKNFIVISAGFSETGEEGEKQEKELEKIAADNDLNILGPNCLGFINPSIFLNASFAAGMPQRGNVGLVSQSGALAVALMDVSKKEVIRFSNVVSVGNKMQLDECDLIEYFENDAKTEVIALYLEGIKDGKIFLEVVRRVSRKKPVIILKAGKSERTQRAISSHTGALAGSDEIMSVAFEESGVLRADNLEEFFDLIKVTSNFNCNGEGSSVILTNAGGPGVLATDHFSQKKVFLKELDGATKEKLREFLPQESSVENPIDLLGDADDVRYEESLKVLDDAGTENILCVMTAQDQTPVQKIAKVICDFQKRSSNNIFPVFIGGEKMKKALNILQENNLPNFEFPQKAIQSLSKYYSWKEMSKESDATKKDLDAKRAGKVKEIISRAKGEKRKSLLFDEASQIMELYGIKTVDFLSLSSKDDLPDDIGFDFPVVVKVDSDKVLHKTEKQGLVLGIKNNDELIEAIEKIRKNFPNEKIIVQPMIGIEAELILGMKKDSIFGGVTVFGLGGIYAEVFKMVDFLISPISKKEIENKIQKSKIGFLFEETRGKKVGDLGEIAGVLDGFSSLVCEADEIFEIDINPLIITKQGDLVAVDVKIIIE